MEETRDNGWAEHKVHVNAELRGLRGDVDKVSDALTNHLIEEAKFWAEVKSEIKYHSKVIIGATTVLSIIFSAAFITILPKLF